MTKGNDLMFVHNVNDKYPIKIWAERDTIEDSCLEQAEHIAMLPFTYKWAALMPDTHTGKGMPIGGVVACDGAVIPNAVGVDIGCGMAFVQTDIPVALLRETITGSGTLLQLIIGNILRNIPTGFSHYKTVQSSAVLDSAKEELSKYENDPELINNIDDGYFQIGITLSSFRKMKTVFAL